MNNTRYPKECSDDFIEVEKQCVQCTDPSCIKCSEFDLSVCIKCDYTNEILKEGK